MIGLALFGAVLAVLVALGVFFAKHRAPYARARDLLNTGKTSLNLREGEHVVVFYNRNVDKWKLFSTYVREGLEKGDRVIYAYPIEDSELVRAKLKDNGVEVEKSERTGALVLMDISRVCMRNGVIDKGQLINFWNDFKADTKKGGFKHERDLFDLGDLTFLGNQKDYYFEYLKEANAELMDPFMVELRAVNSENLSPELIREFKFLSTKSMDLLEYSDKFSRRLGKTHNQIASRNLLLEFDPASNYEEAVLDFVLEASANAETVVVFTNRGSAIHSKLVGQENVKFMLLTQLSPTSPASKQSDGILVPAGDVSLLLDSLSVTIRSINNGSLNLVFDNLTSLILQVGFEKTYSFTRYALEMLDSERATTMFLLNPTSHEQKVVSSLRSLFGSQIDFHKAGLEVVKLPDLQVVTR
jgi:KaiC/GvpD/RAD55 family RecA-like ATPase